MTSVPHTQSAVANLLHARLWEATQAPVMQFMWLVNGEPTPLLADQTALPLPGVDELERLASGQPAHCGGVSFFPMLVFGSLRGWVALQQTDVDPILQASVTQAGLELALLEHAPAVNGHNRELALLDRVGRLLSTTLDLAQLLPSLAEIVRELVVAHDFYIALINEESSTLTCVYLSTAENAPIPLMSWPTSVGLTGHIIATGEPLVTDDYVAECARRGIQPRRPPGLQQYSRAWLGVPLSHHDHVLGVMVASSTDPNLRYSEADVQLMSSVAAQAAVAVANAQLYDRVRQQTDQLALINRIGRTISATLDVQEVPTLIMQELQTALDVQDGALWIEDRRTHELIVRHALKLPVGTRLPAGVGLAGAALQQSRVLIGDDRTMPVVSGNGAEAMAERSVICAPLAGRQRLRGVLQLRSKPGRVFENTDAQLLAAVAEQAAVALENAELYSHTDSALAAHIADLEDRNRQLTNILSLSNTLRSSHDVTSVGEQIVATVQRMTGSPRVVLGLLEPPDHSVRAVALRGLPSAYITPRRELWTPLWTIKAMLEQATPLGTVVYHVGQHQLTPGMDDSVLLTLLDPDGRLVGVISFDAAESTEALSEALLHELEIVANHAAVAVVNARLASEQTQTVDRLTALNALSLAVTTTQLSTDEIMQMTVRGAIGTTNGLGGGWSVLRRDDTQRHQVLNLEPECDVELRPLLEKSVDDYLELYGGQVPANMSAAGVRSVLVVAVRGAKLTLGSLWIGYGESSIAPGEREMVVLYAKMAGAVLENLRLFDQVSSAHDRLASILASTDEGMLMANAQGRVAAANGALLRLLGLPNEQLEGRSIFEVCAHPALVADTAQLKHVCKVLQGVARGEESEAEGELSLSGTASRDLAWSVLPVRGAVNQRAGGLLVLRDITAERQTEKLRQDLANMIVHDLRAPLTNMIVSNDLLLKQISGPLTAAQKRIVEIASNSSQQMLDLVNALLDIRRLEQRQIELQRQPVELFEIVESVFERLERTSSERQVELVNATAALPPVVADVDLLRRVMQNLVDNATKFSPRGSEIRVDASVAEASELPPSQPPGRWALIAVTDRGQGVPDAYRQVIFELFGQSPAGRGQGTGVGLAFCKMAVAAHGGQIWVEDAPGGGAVFRFTFPLA